MFASVCVYVFVCVRVCVRVFVLSCVNVRVCMSVRMCVCTCLREEGEKEKYIWADLPDFCGSDVCAKCLPRVHNDY